MARAAAARTPTRAEMAQWGIEDVVGCMTAMLEEGTDTTEDEVPFDTFMEDPAWADYRVWPRQRLVMKVTDNAIHQAPLENRLGRVRLEGHQALQGTEEDPELPARFAAAMSHAVGYDADGVMWYDELADYRYLLGGENRYARVFVNYNPNRYDPVKLIHIMGRGSSKTTYLSGGASAYLAYRILSRAKPHAHFGLEPTKMLRLQNVATSSEQAGEFFEAFKTIVERVRWFDGKYDPPGMQVLRFPPHLVAEKSSSNSKSGRGRDTVGYFHDEMAYNEKTDGPRSDRKLFRGISAAVKTRAKGHGVIQIVSTPAESDGQLFDLYTMAEAGKLANSVCFQIATWEMVPGQTRENYADEYRIDEDSAEMEFGAQFYTGSSKLLPNVAASFGKMAAAYSLFTGTTGPAIWLPGRDREADASYLRRQRRFPRMVHTDTSEGGDRTAVVMTHLRGRRLVIDLARAWDREVNFSTELEPFLKMLGTRFDVEQFSFDQADSLQLKQNLVDAGFNAIKTAFTLPYNDAISRNFRRIVTDGLLCLPAVPAHVIRNFANILGRDDWDIDDELWPHISMLLLQKEMAAANKVIKGKHMAAVAPTSGVITTDDLLDAAMGAAYQTILLHGGPNFFETLPGGPRGFDPKNDPVEEARAAGMRDVFCAHHKGYVRVDDKERIARCPECNGVIQVRM